MKKYTGIKERHQEFLCKTDRHKWNQPAKVGEPYVCTACEFVSFLCYDNITMVLRQRKVG